MNIWSLRYTNRFLPTQLHILANGRQKLFLQCPIPPSFLYRFQLMMNLFLSWNTARWKINYNNQSINTLKLTFIFLFISLWNITVGLLPIWLHMCGNGCWAKWQSIYKATLQTQRQKNTHFGSIRMRYLRPPHSYIIPLSSSIAIANITEGN
jgi:hypothetical protein